MQPSEALVGRLHNLVKLAQNSGFRVDGLHLAKAFLNEVTLARMEQLVFNPRALEIFRARAGRIEFIVEGPVPAELLRESPLKQEAIFRQAVAYDLCKSCSLCINVCPKDVYVDDRFGKPDKDQRRDEECTGTNQCGKCVDVCPENAIEITLADPAFASTLFLLLDNPFATALLEAEAGGDFYLANPLETGRPLNIRGEVSPNDLLLSNRVLDESNFHPVFEINGAHRHFVDSPRPAEDLKTWARENHREPELVLAAIKALYAHLPRLSGLKEGKYALGEMLHRIADEIILAEVDLAADAGLELLKKIIDESYVAEAFFGAKRRPIGGLLPPGTSPAWKTPYGNMVPAYVHAEKCLGPECALCVTNCPEGSGGETAAIRMVPQVPLGTIPSLVRGLEVFVLKLDGSHSRPEEMENLTGQTPFKFAVNPDYCKSCGTCLTCCPHGVIEPTVRQFNLGGTQQ
ncbi:hypothetical protein A2625_06105 [candidate division WOR-1 bacterium RIFCSPHIGHO2_01_FULL_53_15]|uniref:4Fe-4S ferredoxin-type domain-containing protein n=1 Tax=candidate division WOR-1 bacterium RIFCSPHIGHO2_01_FULL_53_15 TaxID=1802564 RepID=A0A1F4Q180_UNCSA|nr:MAG: hypothetical protein A2625_06105 [candidate division WOR-1 bacterium RIFCSPHIGHO2_01_FULL_53_15]OGC13837.1 MAG: hypothetical protein A3D23_02115 [candidate division WOR-1 bacterium RIFCSPHIGHO2_02_FULL_53_26]